MKKLNGLEALQDIRLRIFMESDVQSKKVVKDLKIIEQELKDGEKNKQAFEIIKVKQVQVNRLNRSHSYKQYNLYLPKEMHLTQEEFDLLKRC